jgi:hypothetical protein
LAECGDCEAGRFANLNRRWHGVDMPKPKRFPIATATAGLIPILLGPVCANAMAVDAAGQLPRRVRLANWGVNKARGLGPNGTDATLIVNEVTASVLPGLQTARGYDLVALDFEHQSDPNHANYKQGPLDVAGHGKISVVPGEGVFWEAARYTPVGRQYAASYPDVSGVFWVNKKNEVILISSVALTLNGAVEGAEFVEAEQRYLAACIAAAIGYGKSGKTADKEAMKRRVQAAMEGTPEEQMVALAKELLGYGEEARAEDVAKGLAKLVQAKRAAAEMDDEGDDDDDDEEEEEDEGAGLQKPTTIFPTEKPNKTTEIEPAMSKEITDKLDALTKSVETLANQMTPIAASVAKLQERDDTVAHNTAVEAVITASVAAGKVVPASIKAKDEKGRYVMTAEAATEIMGCITASVKTEKPGAAKPSETAELSAAEEEARIACGISKEDWNKETTIRIANEPTKVALVS